MINQNFIYLGVLLNIIGASSYLIDTVKGKIKPNRVSWFIWMLAPLIAFAAEVKQGVGIASLATFVVGFMPLLVLIGSFLNKKSEWKINSFDLICGLLSVIGIILWMITRVGNVAIFFSILADGLASVPTVVKSYHHPETENDHVFMFQIANAGIALLTIKSWSFQNWGFPAYLLINGVVLTALIRFKLGKIKIQKTK